MWLPTTWSATIREGEDSARPRCQEALIFLYDLHVFNTGLVLNWNLSVAHITPRRRERRSCSECQKHTSIPPHVGRCQHCLFICEFPSHHSMTITSLAPSFVPPHEKTERASSCSQQTTTPSPVHLGQTVKHGRSQLSHIEASALETTTPNRRK